MVDKFIGDAAMVVLGILPGPSNEAADALSCSNLIFGELVEWNRSRQKDDQPQVRVGIGIHWGEVFCGSSNVLQRAEIGLENE